MNHVLSILREQRCRLIGFAMGLLLGSFVAFRPQAAGFGCSVGLLLGCLSSPFTLRTPRGRLWWAAFISLYASVFAASRFALDRSHSPVPLLITVLACGIFGSYVGWLRWQPMPDAAAADAT